MRLIAVIMLVLLCAGISSAGDINIQTEKLQLSSVVGTLGVAAAAFWPVVQAPEYGVTLGPLVAVGTQTVVAGLAVRVGISIDAPILSELDTGWAGRGYDWIEDTTSWEFGVGKSWEM